ncbi:Uncharacterised protein [Chlamydia abortus]|nr:Uncharacterised protein [Chlamydia abortus]
MRNRERGNEEQAICNRVFIIGLMGPAILLKIRPLPTSTVCWRTEPSLMRLGRSSPLSVRNAGDR